MRLVLLNRVYLLHRVARAGASSSSSCGRAALSFKCHATRIQLHTTASPTHTDNHHRARSFGRSHIPVPGPNPASGTRRYAKPKGSSTSEDADVISEDVAEVSTEDVEGPSTRDMVVDENSEWGQKALEVAQQILETNDDLSLYAFRAIANTRTVDIRLDKLSDTYGSPTLDEIGAFSRDFNERFEALIGEEEAGGIEVEVSSPGATRAVKVPDELERFKELAMEIVTADEPSVRVMAFKGFAENGDTEWMYADVKANRSLNKGRGLNKKARETVFVVKVPDIVRLNIHIDL